MMKKVWKILTLRNINLFLFLLIAALIPFAMNLISYTMGLWLISSVILIIKERKRLSRPIFSLEFGFLTAFYLFVLAGILWSDNKADALFDAQVKLSFLLIPLPVLILAPLYREYRHPLMLVFVFANVLAGLICILTATWHSFHFDGAKIFFDSQIPGVYDDVNTSPSSYFSYTDFSLFKHPAYFSMYLSMSVFFLINLIFNGFSIFKRKTPWYFLVIFSFLILVLSIFFLRSKAGYFSLFLLIFIAALVFLIRRRKIWLAIIATIVIISLAFLSVRTNSRFYYITAAWEQRADFAQTIKGKDYRMMIDKYGIDRIPLWCVAVEAASENFWLGSGSGDVHTALNKKFAKYNLFELEQNHYNAHNQFLESFLANGIGGFVCLLSFLLVPLFRRKFWSASYWPAAVLCALLIMNFLFESMLNSFSGVIFTVFFYSYFVLSFSYDQKAAKTESLAV